MYNVLLTLYNIFTSVSQLVTVFLLIACVQLMYNVVFAFFVDRVCTINYISPSGSNRERMTTPSPRFMQAGGRLVSSGLANTSQLQEACEGGHTDAAMLYKCYRDL